MYHPPQTKNFHFFILLLTLPDFRFESQFQKYWHFCAVEPFYGITLGFFAKKA